jgi:calmodulin
MKNMDPDNEVRECYRRFDPDNEGAVKIDELRFIMRNLPVKLTPEEIEEIVTAADVNGDGKITFQEFRRMLGH